MRNISQYPMTNEEAIRILIRIKEELQELKLMGDIRPYALSWVVEKLSKESTS